MARVKYALYCSAPWMIFFYTMLFYVVMLIVDVEGLNISNRIGATTTTTLFLGLISLDATDCSRCFRLYVFGFGFFGMVSGLFLASFVWADGECRAAIHLCPELNHQFLHLPRLPSCVFSRSPRGFPSSDNRRYCGRDHQEWRLHSCVLQHDLAIAACTHLCVDR